MRRVALRSCYLDGPGPIPGGTGRYRAVSGGTGGSGRAVSGARVGADHVRRLLADHDRREGGGHDPRRRARLTRRGLTRQYRPIPPGTARYRPVLALVHPDNNYAAPPGALIMKTSTRGALAALIASTLATAP